MSTVGIKKRYSSVMEKIIKNAVSETSKVLETVIAELKAEVLRVNSENENLKIRCSQFEEVVRKRSVYRETGTSPDPWIIGKCDKAVQCDFIPHFSNDDPNLSDNETRHTSESSFGPIYEKDIDDSYPLDLSNITIPEKTVADYGKKEEAMLVDRSELHLQFCNTDSSNTLSSDDEQHQDSDTCSKTPEMEIQEDVCIEYAESDQSLLECQEEGIKDLAEKESIPLQEDIKCISTETEDVICKKPQPKECDPCPLIALAAESTSSSNDPQPATEELLEMDVEMDKQSTTLCSAELKSGDFPAADRTDTKFGDNFQQEDASDDSCCPPDKAVISEDKNANVLIGFEHKTCTDPAAQSVSNENINAKEPGNTSQSLPPTKSQYFLRRQRCTSVTLEDAMLLLDAVSQQKYKSSSTKKHQTKDSSKNAAIPKFCNIPEVTPQDSSNSEEMKCTSEPLKSHATQSSDNNEMADDLELNVCMTNMDIVGQQKQETNLPSDPSLLVDVVIDCGVPRSTPIGQKSPHVTAADSASLSIDHPCDHQELLSPSVESSATFVTESTTPNQKNLGENVQTVDIKTTNMNIEESDKTDPSIPKPSLIEPPSNVSVPLVAVPIQNKKTSKHEQLLEMEEIVSSDNFTNDSRDNPKSLSEECSHTEYLSEPPERSEVAQLTPDHLTQKNNQAMEVDLTPLTDMSPSKLLAKALSEPTWQTSTHDSSELQGNDRTASSPIPSSILNPPIPHTMLIKLPGETGEQSSSVVKTTSASTLSPAQLSAVVSAVRSTQIRTSPTGHSAGTPSGKKSLVALPFSLQAVLRPHHKIIVIPRQCKVASTQAIAKDKVIVLKQKESSTDATTTFISTTDVNLDTNSGEGNNVSDMDQQQTTSVSPSTKSFLDTETLTTEPGSSDLVKSPCKNTIQIKLNRLPFPVSSAQSVSVTDMPMNTSSTEDVSATNTPVYESPTIISATNTPVYESPTIMSATNTPVNEPPRIIVRKKRGRPAKKNIVAISSSQAQSEEEKLHSTIIGPSRKEASPIQASSEQNAKSIEDTEPTAVQSRGPENQSPTLANQSPSSRNQSPASTNQLPVMKTLLSAPENQLPDSKITCPATKIQLSMTETQLPAPENHSATPEQLFPVVTGDHSYPQHRMTKSQFLAKLEVSPVAQSLKKADSIETDIQKASLVDRLRSHLKPHIKTLKKKKQDVTYRVEVKGAISNTTQETLKPNQNQHSENSSLPDPVGHNDENKTKTSPAPKSVSNKAQVQRKRSPKRNLMPTKKAKKQKLKKEESDNETITSSAKLSPMRSKLINSNALLSCVRKGIKKKSFLCKFCRKEFGKKKDIELHIQIHVGKKPFQCNICQRRFSRTMELSRHLKRHNAEKKYQCTSCGKSFIEYNNLKRHTYIHTGEKPFSCPHCPSTFTQSGHMKTHIRNKHKNIDD